MALIKIPNVSYLDSPSKRSPDNREVLLWMVINVPGHIAKRGTVPGISANAGETVVEYAGPRPKSGTGRFANFVYQTDLYLFVQVAIEWSGWRMNSALY